VVAEREDAVERARTMLGAGRIVAVKGLGGFHLACDAADERAVAELRARKGRPCKPLAVMCRDLEVAGARCEVSDAEALELSRPSRPILLLRARGAPLDGLRPIAASVAPRLGELGVMLPYTPLHHLLLEPGAPPCLVMTSGNESGLPIQADEREAVGALGRVADAFLVHDRAIWNRCDDSVGCVRAGRLVVMRRSRGLAPLPVALDAEVRPTLALGAMLCNTVVIASGRRAFFSQHIGDAETEETLDLLREIVDKLGRWLGIEPEIVAHDLHPDLPTTHLAVELGAARRRVAVQHHHAHLAAAMAAAGVRGEAIGLVLDGTGYGTDASIWGGEILVGSAERVRRAGHLRPLPLPGGDAAIKRPLRTAVAYVRAMAPELESAPLAMWHRARPGELDGVRRMVDRGLRTPRTTSAGRLFDAVAALLDVADDNTYEGQAAIELEHLARRGEVLRGPRIGLDVSTEAGSIVIDPAPAIRGLGEAALACGGASRADLAACFHAALSDALATSAGFARDAGGPATVVLCGGVFQNRILDESVSERLVRMGFDVVRPGQVPVNDGGLALGQVLVANRAEQRDGAGAAGWEA
jgi:hydrogenase maturation protein HypF